MGINLPAVDVGPSRTVQFMAPGEDHTCARLDDGAIKCWGNNDFGQLGLGDKLNRSGFPAQMGSALPTVPLQ